MRAPRTVLEQKIRERRQTLEEFAEYVETFAREHHEPGTLGVRHLQRLVAGRRPDGRPLGQVKPETARLLEHILGVSIDELLSPANVGDDESTWANELRQTLDVSSRVDGAWIDLLRERLSIIRRLDRQYGAISAHSDVEMEISQVDRLLAYSQSDDVRTQLAALLSELHCLAGWQALDMGNVNKSWKHYDNARTAAILSGFPSHVGLATAGQGFVLIDIGETRMAAERLTATREKIERRCSPLVRAWLAAAHGETLAADKQRDASLRAFDDAASVLRTDTAEPDGPYVALDLNHLTRWRGHALARCAYPEAIDVLTRALDRHDRTFARAETALRVDLTAAYVAIDERGAALRQAEHADRLATKIGSKRQHRRIKALTQQITRNTT